MYWPWVKVMDQSPGRTSSCRPAARRGIWAATDTPARATRHCNEVPGRHHPGLIITKSRARTPSTQMGSTASVPPRPRIRIWGARTLSSEAARRLSSTSAAVHTTWREFASSAAPRGRFRAKPIACGPRCVGTIGGVPRQRGAHRGRSRFCHGPGPLRSATTRPTPSWFDRCREWSYARSGGPVKPSGVRHLPASQFMGGGLPERVEDRTPASTRGVKRGLTDMEPASRWSFSIEFEGLYQADPGDQAGCKMEKDVIELKHNTNDGSTQQKLPGPARTSGEVTGDRGPHRGTRATDWIRRRTSAPAGLARVAP